MLYKEIKEEYNEILNKHNFLFMIIAFNDKDFEEDYYNNLKKYNVKSEDLVCVAGNMFFLKKDWQKVKEASKKQNKRIREELIPNDEEFKKAIIYEMNNYEYIVSYNMHTILERFSLSMTDYNKNEHIKNIFDKAERQYFDSFEN